MNAHPEADRGPVAIVGLSPRDDGLARDAVTLAGARVCEDPARALLVLAAPDSPVPAIAPCVRVGAGAQVSLPGDQALLISLIAEASWGRARNGHVWVVAGISGGVGVTSLVRLLARGGGRFGARGLLGVARRSRGVCRGAADAHAWDEAPVIVDASGSVPGVARARHHDAPGVRWADLEASEDSYLPALRNHLPLIDGVRALVGDSRGAASPDDPRVAAACRSLGAPLIVDAGRWDQRAARLTEVIRADALILMTRGDLDGAAAMAACLALAPAPCPALTLVAGERVRRSPGLVECAPTPILRAPTRRGRDLRALSRALASFGVHRVPRRADSSLLEASHA